MLKLTIHRHESKTTVTLEGRLSGQWVAELERCWQEEMRGVPASAITVLLRNIAYVNSEGKTLLQRIACTGTRIEGTGCMTRALVDAIVESAGTPNEVRTTEEPTSTEFPRKTLGIVFLAAALLSAAAFAQENPAEKQSVRAVAEMGLQSLGNEVA